MLILLRTSLIAINADFHLTLSPLNHFVSCMADDMCRWHRLAPWHMSPALAANVSAANFRAKGDEEGAEAERWRMGNAAH